MCCAVLCHALCRALCRALCCAVLCPALCCVLCSVCTGASCVSSASDVRRARPAAHGVLPAVLQRGRHHAPAQHRAPQGDTHQASQHHVSLHSLCRSSYHHHHLLLLLITKKEDNFVIPFFFKVQWNSSICGK